MTEPTPAELNESAMNHFSRGNGVEAARQLQWALIGDPMYAEAWHNRAMILKALNDPFDAVLCCERAIKINEKCAAYYNTMGVCWASMTQFKDAIRFFKRALEIDEKLAAAHYNMASAVRLGTNDLARAVLCSGSAVQLDPDNADYHVSYAAALLRAGELRRGFDEYEWRHKTSDAFHRHMPLPMWDGDLAVKGLVLYAEQGYGDAIQFLRFVPKIKRLLSDWGSDAKVYVEVKKPMAEIARTMNGVYGVVVYGDDLPEDATHCLPLMSAARFCGINTVDDLKSEPYLAAEPRRFSQLEPRKLKVGICWKTGVRPYQPELFSYAESKSIGTHFLMPLEKIDGVQWVSLQMPRPDVVPFEMIDLSDYITDFMDTARIMKALDLVVSVDTSVAHLAGALGVYSYVLTPFDNCWRWLGGRTHSPWYPTLSQIRQPAPGDWPSVVETLARHIHSHVKLKGAGDGH